MENKPRHGFFFFNKTDLRQFQRAHGVRQKNLDPAPMKSHWDFSDFNLGFRDGAQIHYPFFTRNPPPPHEGKTVPTFTVRFLPGLAGFSSGRSHNLGMGARPAGFWTWSKVRWAKTPGTKGRVGSCIWGRGRRGPGLDFEEARADREKPGLTHHPHGWVRTGLVRAGGKLFQNKGGPRLSPGKQKWAAFIHRGGEGQTGQGGPIPDVAIAPHWDCDRGRKRPGTAGGPSALEVGPKRGHGD